MAESHYGGDLAAIHDAHFGGVARVAAPLVVHEMRRGGHRGGLVVDLGCGSGILARGLTEATYNVLGIDYSHAMVRLARKAAPKARIIQGSVWEVEIPTCVGVTAIGEVFNYAFDGRTGMRGMERLFARIHRALEPGGVLVFDMAGPGRADGGETFAFHDDHEWTMLARTSEDPASGSLTRDITLFRRTPGGMWRRTDEQHHLKLFGADEIEDRLRTVGFAVRRVRGYGDDIRFGPGWTAFVARKRV